MKNKEINAKKILVTGGAGFIGSNLCESLLKNGAIVYSLDNFLTGKEENLQTLLSNKNFTSITGDIRDFKVCQSATEDIDFVLHNAAIGSVPRSIENPIETNENNITGFLNILKSISHLLK